MLKIARISFFASNPFGDGGAKRTSQITDILKKRGIKEDFYRLSDLFEEAKKTIVLKRGRSLLNGIKNIGYYKKLYSSYGSIAELNNFGYQMFLVCMVTQKLKEYDVVISECNRYEYYLFNLVLLNSHPKVIFVPHNLESLVPGVERNKYDYFLSHELGLMAKASKVYAISREEQWLLNVNGIKSRFLPYFPENELTENLVRIATKRKDSEKSFFLVMGTAGNEPTYLGMKSLALALLGLDIKVKLVGYGTEKLIKEIRSDGSIDILGPVTTNELNKLYENTKACIIYQGYSSGALTKIPELQLADIPIIVDEGSARSYYGISGITVYRDLDQLVTFLSSPSNGLINQETTIDLLIEDLNN
jgi:hypothetical protein